MLPAAGEARRATSSPTTTSAMELLAEQVEIARGDRLVHVVVDVGDREVSGRIEAGMQIVEIHSSEGYRRVICSRAAKTANVYQESSPICSMRTSLGEMVSVNLNTSPA